jgi:hypothetical protein
VQNCTHQFSKYLGVWWGSVGAMKCTIDIKNPFHNDKVGHLFCFTSKQKNIENYLHAKFNIKSA